MAFRPSKDVATQLAIDLGASFTLGTNLFYGPVRPAGDGIPSRAVFVLTAGGGETDELFRRNTIVNHNLVLLVRGSRDNYDDTEGLAFEVWRTSRNMDVSTVESPVTKYISVLTTGSGPASLGQNEKEEWEFSWTIEAKYLETS